VIDHNSYPDVEHGEGFGDDYDRADYSDACAASDFGVPPDRDTVTLFRDWRDVFDRFPIPDSPSYHALRAHFRWSAVPVESSFYLRSGKCCTRSKAAMTLVAISFSRGTFTPR